MSDEDLARTKALLDGISADALLTSARQRRYLIYTSTAVVLVGALSYVVGAGLHQTQLVRPAGWLLLFVPICVGLTLKETSKKIVQRDPVMAQRLCNWLAFGNPVALSHLSSMYADVGNYAKAEKLLVAACKTVPVKNVGLHIVMHANLAAARARSGSISAAERMFQETLDAAKNLNSVRPVPSSSVVLATTLYYGAELKAQKQEYQSVRVLLTQAFEQLAVVKNPPVEVLVAVLALLGRACTILGSDAESLLYLAKARDIVD
ncbi:tetratricopeptide repeat protein, partial [uncultured Thiodictyon sp.]|uniref:tetratricopeptide repeat protein n=1 Tax=uncultured Thiodictyon sp. TaxID=1846217 RepID=UPI0025FF10CF